MHEASQRFMPLCDITETTSDAESVEVVHFIQMPLTAGGLLRYQYIGFYGIAFRIFVYDLQIF